MAVAGSQSWNAPAATIWAGSVNSGTSPGGPNAEGFPASAPASGPSIDRSPGIFGKPGELGPPINDNYLHYNPYPNVAGPGQPQECEAGNETYVPGQAEIGNLPASDVSNNREITNREDDLFGEKYSANTLKALGLAKAPPKAKAKSKTKGKAKGKGK